ncbi:hypothetical protein K501DRAFT_274706 [Backusella circina FSU 941]|nr:hypothetical protein K501DRAFT_274706 [Backusella circina FSU 941]
MIRIIRATSSSFSIARISSGHDACIRNLRGNVSPPTKHIKKAVHRFVKERIKHVSTYLLELQSTSETPVVKRFIHFFYAKNLILATIVMIWPAGEYKIISTLIIIDHRYRIMSSKRKEYIFDPSHSRMVIMHYKSETIL